MNSNTQWLFPHLNRVSQTIQEVFVQIVQFGYLVKYCVEFVFGDDGPGRIKRGFDRIHILKMVETLFV